MIPALVRNRESGVQSQHWLCSKFRTSLGYMRLYDKKEEKKKKQQKGEVSSDVFSSAE